MHTKDRFLEQLQIISKMQFMQKLTPFLYGEDALLLKLHLNEAHTPSEMAEQLNITKGRVTAIMRALKEKSLIKVEQKVNDRRFLNILLTDKGQAHILNRIAYVDHYFDQFLKFIGQGQSNQLVEMLDILIRKINAFEVEQHG